MVQREQEIEEEDERLRAQGMVADDRWYRFDEFAYYTQTIDEPILQHKGDDILVNIYVYHERSKKNKKVTKQVRATVVGKIVHYRNGRSPEGLPTSEVERLPAIEKESLELTVQQYNPNVEQIFVMQG